MELGLVSQARRLPAHRGTGGGEVNSPSIDVFQDRTPGALNHNVLDPSLPHVIFNP
jgi:hypothetical protein